MRVRRRETDVSDDIGTDGTARALGDQVADLSDAVGSMLELVAQLYEQVTTTTSELAALVAALIDRHPALTGELAEYREDHEAIVAAQQNAARFRAQAEHMRRLLARVTAAHRPH